MTYVCIHGMIFVLFWNIKNTIFKYFRNWKTLVVICTKSSSGHMLSYSKTPLPLVKLFDGESTCIYRRSWLAAWREADRREIDHGRCGCTVYTACVGGPEACRDSSPQTCPSRTARAGQGPHACGLAGWLTVSWSMDDGCKQCVYVTSATACAAARSADLRGWEW
jgi:hypothetical protein